MSAVLFALALATVPTTPPITLVKNGKSDYEIVVIGAAGYPSVDHGAQEIQTYIKEMSGATLKIVRLENSKQSFGKHLIYVARADSTLGASGDVPVGEEEYSINVARDGIHINGGGKRGVMYGCYAFLEDVLGVRWYNSRVTKVPKRKTITVPALDIEGKPGFEYREPFIWEAFDKDWAARNRTNGNSQRLDASVGGKVSYGPFVHTFAEICPPEKYFDTHPEYFSMINGKRMNGYYQLCLTNSEVVKLAVEKVEQWIKDYPDATIFSVSQNDTYNNCQCPDCLAVEKEEGAPSGPLIRFVNKVAEEVEKRHPKVLIDTLAYQWSEKPPLKVRPRKNVRIRIALIGACYSHPLDGCTENAAPFQNLKDWAKITSNIYIWHYTTNFSHYLQPLPNLDEISGDVALFKKYGVVGLFDEGGYAAGGCSELGELKAYLLAKLMWDPLRKPQSIIDDYVQGVYREAAPFLTKWIALTNKSGREMKSHARIYDPPSAPYLNEDVLREGQDLFDKAERAVATDPRALDEVQRTRLSLEYVQLMRADKSDPRSKTLSRVVADKIAKYGITSVREGEPVAEFLKRIGQ